MWHLPSDINRSRISHAKIVGFSLLYCSILDTTAGVATFGFDPPISPGGRKVPAKQNHKLVDWRSMSEISEKFYWWFIKTRKMLFQIKITNLRSRKKAIEIHVAIMSRKCFW
jgi:hypothetical protein